MHSTNGMWNVNERTTPLRFLKKNKKNPISRKKRIGSEISTRGEGNCQVENYLPSGFKITDMLTALHSLPCCKLIAFIASLSGNIGKVAVGRKIEVPLCIASLWTRYMVL